MHFVRDFDLKLGSEINMKSFIYVCGVAKSWKRGRGLALGFRFGLDLGWSRGSLVAQPWALYL